MADSGTPWFSLLLFQCFLEGGTMECTFEASPSETIGAVIDPASQSAFREVLG
jgi:hypothetical protein